MHWKETPGKSKPLNYAWIIVSIFFLSCSEKKANNSISSPEPNNAPVYYQLQNADQSVVSTIDSVLNKDSVAYCYFQFSALNDTLGITFVLGSGLRSYYEDTYNTNRYFSLQNHNVLVVSNEDFFLRSFNDSVRTNLINDNGYVKLLLTFPKISIIYIDRFPPLMMEN